MEQSTTPTRGYSASKEHPPASLRRTEGQLRGIQGMVNDDRLLHRRADADRCGPGPPLHKVALGFPDGHAHTCVVGAADERHARAAEMAAVGRLMRRG